MKFYIYFLFLNNFLKFISKIEEKKFTQIYKFLLRMFRCIAEQIWWRKGSQKKEQNK